MSKAIVRRFYDEIWNAGQQAAMTEILEPEFRFRGSLGVETRGRNAFWAYAQTLRGGLKDYHCHIDDMIEEGDKIFARMTFSGRHVGELLGVEPTGESVAWVGCALFTLSGGKVAELWVLGDLDGLKAQLAGEADAPSLSGKSLNYKLASAPASDTPADMTQLVSSIHIRDARDSDAEGLISLIDSCFQMYAVEGVQIDLEGLDSDLHNWASHLAHDDGEGWIALSEDGEVLGSIGYSCSGEDTIELKRLYVRPTLHGAGLAQRLLAKVEEAAIQIERPRIKLWSDSRFKRGHAFYMRAGYKNSGKTRALGDISNTIEWQFEKTVFDEPDLV